MKAKVASSAWVSNAIARYEQGIRDAIDLLDLERFSRSAGFSPGFGLPELDPDVTHFYAASGLSAADLGSYRGRTLKLLNLMHNPRTRTTKTLPSLVIVARAIEYIRRTGRRVMIVTPTSANKGTALMDAVRRAWECSLASPSELRISVVVPRGSLPKLWRSPLTEDEETRAANPVFVYDGDDPEQVKAIARAFVERLGPELEAGSGVNLWHTMELDNYRVADSVRAYFEADAFPPRSGQLRVHAHAVSSGFGLLGYDLGRRVLARRGVGTGRCPQFFLVQHLRTPDMVLHLRTGSFSRQGVPAYRFDATTGLFVQDEDPAFPTATPDPEESIDPTFYTRRPGTAEAIDAVIAECGGGGVVVSSHECLLRYQEVRAMLSAADVDLPSNPQALREWAVVMCVTGVLNGIDRGLIPERADVVVHGSGSFGADDFDPVDVRHTVPIRRMEDMAAAMLEATGSKE